MHLLLVPGLLLALAVSLGGVPAQPGAEPHNGQHGTGSLFSVAAQATVTATLATTVTTDTTATAASTMTGTSAITPTATITGSVQSTPVPFPQQGGSVPLASNPLDPSFLFSPPPPLAPQIGPYGWGFLGLMVALLLASGYFLLVKRPEWKRTNPVLHRAANKWGQVGLWIAIPGILLLLFRVVRLDFFNMRIWLYLWTLATLVAVGWFVYWLRMKYPKEAEKFQKRQRARQYMPGSASKSAVRQAAQTKSKAVVAPAGDAAATATTATTAATSKPTTQSKPGQRSNRRGKRR